MKRTLLGIVAVAALGATLVSTGAFVDTVEDTHDKIEMEPSDGPNAVYAVEDADGEIKLDLSTKNQELAGEGINEGSLTKIPNIFTVNYSTAADEPDAKVWFTSDAEEGIEFVVGTDSVTSIEEGNKRTLKPADKLHIGVIVDTRGDHDVENVSEFTIHVEKIDGNDESSGESTSNPDDTESGLDSDDNTDSGDEAGGGDEENTTTEGDGDSTEGDGDSTEGDGDSTEGDGGDDETGDTEQGGSEDTDTEDNGGNESEPDDEGTVGNGTSNNSGQNGGDSNGEQGSNDDNDDGGGLQTAGQGPSFPGPEETLGGFLSGTFLWLIVAVLLGAALFGATRYGTDRFGGEA